MLQKQRQEFVTFHNCTIEAVVQVWKTIGPVEGLHRLQQFELCVALYMFFSQQHEAVVEGNNEHFDFEFT
jgi:hypothetical protein